MNYRYIIIAVLFIIGILIVLLSILVNFSEQRLGIMLGALFVFTGFVLHSYWSRPKKKYRILRRSSKTAGEDVYIIQQQNHFLDFIEVEQGEHTSKEAAEKMLAVIMGDLQGYSEEIIFSEEAEK